MGFPAVKLTAPDAGTPRRASVGALRRPSPTTMLRWGAGAIGAACVVAVTYFWLLQASPSTPGDTLVYLLTGQRLNAGHHMYSYSPGDAHGPDFGAPIPILSPPLIGVLFRLIVLLPANGEYIWWGSMVALELGAIAVLLIRAPMTTGLLLVPLSPSIARATMVGNIDCLVMPGLLLCWWLVREDRAWLAAALVAVLASLKLTPVVLIWWLWTIGRRTAAVVGVVCGIALALVATLATEPLVFLRFYEISTGYFVAPPAEYGPIGVLHGLGASPAILRLVPTVTLLVGAGVMWATRRTPGVSYAVGVLLMWWVSPVSALHTPAIVLAAIAPLAWRMNGQPAGGLRWRLSERFSRATKRHAEDPAT